MECSWEAKSGRPKCALCCKGDEREQPALELARKGPMGFPKIAASIEREFGEPWESLKSRRGHPGRSLAILMCRRHTALKLHEIGKRCGGWDYAAVSQANHRMENKLYQDRRLAAVAQRIEERLENVQC